MLLGAAQKLLDQFLADIQPVRAVYQEESFSYFAVKSDSDFVLIRGTLYFNVMTPAVDLGHFVSANVKAGHFKIADLELSSDEFIEKIAIGLVMIPGGELKFLGNGNAANYGANYHPFHQLGLQQRRVAVLSLLGAQNTELFDAKLPGLDWEVRAASQPYDGTQELFAVFQPGVNRSVNQIDLAAVEVAAIEGSSVVSGEEAKLSVRMANRGTIDKLSVGVRVSAQGKVTERKLIPGSMFSWSTDQKGMRLGEIRFLVPRAAIVQAIANYNGIAQHHYFFSDPHSFQNPRRAAYEAFDARLEILSDIIAKAQGRGQEARDFESTVAWVFWMLGFAPVYLGGPKRMSDAADFLASSPAGHIAVVECTTGILKDDSKLQKLHDRAESVRRNLSASKSTHIRVLPVIVTSKSAEAIRPDMEQAQRLGIYVIAGEALRDLLPQTLLPQNADQMFEQAYQSTKGDQVNFGSEHN